MEIDNLLTQIKPKKSTPTPKYIAIEINLHSVKTALWESINHKPNLISTGTIEECNPDDPKDLLQATDTSLSKALDGIDPEPDEVIFSFPESWVEKNSVASAKKSIVKTLIDKLALKPVGFVVTTEAMVQYLKQKHGGPFSGILVGTSDEEAQIILVKTGQIINSQVVGRSNDLGSDVEEGLARFDYEDDLPSSIILFDGTTDLETEKQELLSYDWQARLQFLHLPKITSFQPEETIQAVVLAGGAEVIKSIQADSESPPTSTKKPKPASTPPAQKTMPNLADEFGFSASPNQPFPQSDNLQPAQPDRDENLDDNPDELEPSADIAADPITSTNSSSLLTKFKSLISKIKPTFSLPHIHFRSPLIALLAIVIFLALGSAGALAAYWYLPKALVTIYLEPKVIQTDIAFTLGTNLDSPDLDSQTLPARILDAQSQGSLTIPVTGTKTIGDPATGTVTIYNRQSSPITLEAGAELIGPDSLTYTIDQSVSIASASTKENPDFSVTIEPKSTTVSVTAITIGANHNLGSGTELSVSGYSTSNLIARAQSDISGGNSQEVAAVSQEDYDTLVEQLTQKLRSQATQNFNQQDDFTSAIFLDSTQPEIDLNPSHDVGDTADNLTLEGSFSAPAYTYKKTDLSLLIQHLISKQKADQYEFLQTASTIDVKSTQATSDTTVEVIGQATAQLAPKLDLNHIASQIKGRYPSVTQDYFRSLPNFSKVAIDIKPKLPDQLHTFPRVLENITITTQVEPSTP